MIKSWSDAELLQKDIDAIGQWCVNNGLQMNIDKCRVMTITKKRHPITYNYTLDGVAIERVNKIRDLGVIIDEHIRFDSHNDEIVRKAAKMNGFVMRMTKSFYLIEPIITLFNQIVRPVLEYCSPSWNPMYGIYIDRIEAIQHSFTRHLYRKFHYPYEPYEQRLIRLGLRSLMQRRQEADVLFLHKLTHSSIHCSLTEALSFRFPTNGLRSVDLFYLPTYKTNVGKSSPVPRICSLYNETYNDVDIFMDFNRFRRMVKQS